MLATGIQVFVGPIVALKYFYDFAVIRQLTFHGAAKTTIKRLATFC
jgi:hypothetical protein